MRILMLVDAYLPSTKSGAKLVHDLGIEFHRLGHETIVVAPDDTLSTRTKSSSENGLTVFRVRMGRIKEAPKIVRGFNEARLSPVFWQRGKRFFQTRPCDLIVYYSPSIFFGALVRKLKKIFACPSYLILRDIFPQWAVDAGVLRKGLIYRFFRYKEMEQYGAADVIGVQSPANLRYFADNGLSNRYQLEVLYNWTTLTEQHIPRCNYRDQLGLQGKVIFFYGGNIGVAQDIDNLVRLAKCLQERNVHFLIVGEGSEVVRLTAQIAAENLTNITIHKAVGQQEYLSMLSEFDVGLITLDRRLKTQNFPGKMLGYMYHAMPILASINPGNDLKEILEEKQAGFVCHNGEDKQLYSYALQMAKDVDLRRRMGRNARALLESTFSVSRAARQILSHVEQ